MTAVLIGQAEPNTEPWYEMRRNGIGASEVAAVLGLSRYMSPFWLWHFKKGNIPAQKVTDAMDWGHRLEPVVRDWFAEQHPEFQVEATPGTYAHKDRSWQRANPDGLCFDGGERVALYEGKTSRFGTGFAKNVIPLDYQAQIQWQLDIFNLPVAYVAVLIGGNEPVEYVVEANPEDQATLRAAAEAFWLSIQNDEEPPLDASDHTYRAVTQLDPEMRKDEHVDLTSDVWGAYLKAKADVDAAEGELTFAKSRVLTAMRGVQFARFAGEKVLRRQRSSAGTYYLKEVV